MNPRVFMPFLLMFGVFYFLLIRPQQKKAREHQAMLARLKKGDRVVTGGGLIGAITKLSDSELEVEIADRVKVRVLRQFVSPLGEPKPAETPLKEKGK